MACGVYIYMCVRGDCAYAYIHNIYMYLVYIYSYIELYIYHIALLGMCIMYDAYKQKFGFMLFFTGNLYSNRLYILISRWGNRSPAGASWQPLL